MVAAHSLALARSHQRDDQLVSDALQQRRLGERATADLDVRGMTCASCAMRVERRLNQLEGVEATVNYATERGARRVRRRPLRRRHARRRRRRARLPRRVAHSRRSPRADRPRRPRPRHARPRRRQPARPARRASSSRSAFAAPVLAISMIGSLQFDGWQWIVMLLAAPVAIWAAWPFHRAMLVNARHRAASMDTLVSLGVIAAYTWSVAAVLFTPAGDWGRTMDMGAGSGTRHPRPLLRGVGGGGRGAARRALPGGPLQAACRQRARGRSPTSAPRRRRCSTPTAASTSCRSTSSSRAIASWCARARRSPPTASWWTARRRSTPRSSQAKACPSTWPPVPSSRARRSTPAGASSCGPRVSGPRRSSLR